VGTNGIVNSLPLDELLVEFLNSPGTLVDFVELFGVGTVGPLHSSVEFGAFRRQHEQADLASLALGFKVSIELRAAIDPQGTGTQLRLVPVAQPQARVVVIHMPK